jgi:hypothetical protein
MLFHSRVAPQSSWGSQWALGVRFLAGVLRCRPAHGVARYGRAPRVGDRAVEQRDAADEGRVDARGTIIVGKVIVNQGKVVRPSQLIASVRRTGPGMRRIACG